MAELEFDQFKQKYRFQILDPVNIIGNAKIYKVTLPGGPVVAVKKIERENETYAESEMKMHRRLSELGGDMFIPTFYDSCITPTHAFIAMEYCKFDSLHSFMDDYFEDGLYQLQFSDFAEILVEMLQCMRFLHSHDIIHRDVKPDNFFIAAGGTIKLGDFGFSSRVEDIEQVYCGTIDFIAPEIIEQHLFPIAAESEVGKPTDVWAFGISAYELAYGYTPWVEKDINSVSRLTKEIGRLLIKKDNFPYFNMPTKTIVSLDMLLQNCLMIKASNRATVSELLDKRPYFLLHFASDNFSFLKKFYGDK